MNEGNVNVICRLCLNNSFLHSNIFAANSTDLSPTYEVINDVYGLQIAIGDGLPEYICENCFTLVKAFKVYKNNAHKAVSEIIRMKQNEDKVENHVTLKEEEEVLEEHGLGVESAESVFPEMVAETEADIKMEETTTEEGDCETIFLRSQESEVLTNRSSSIGFLEEELGNSSRDVSAVNLNHSIGPQEDKLGNSSPDVIDRSSYKARKPADSQGMYICDTCGKVFLTNSKFNKHLDVHRNPKIYSCRTCGKSFKGLDAKNVHELRHLKRNMGSETESMNKEDYVCHTCGKIYSKKNSFRKHVLRHEPGHLCVTCHKLFPTQEALESHIPTHTGLKPFTCDICRLSFTRRSNLDRHLTSHSEDRPYCCKTCNKSFKLKQYRDRHELFHLVQ